MMTQNRDVLAWVAMVTSLALHVVDEALNDFLSFYNLLVENMRESLGFFPMPIFEFRYWIGGLICVVTIGYLAIPLVGRGTRGIKIVMVVAGVLMILNSLGHMAASIYIGRVVPGTLSSPLLLVASLYVVVRGLKCRRLS